MAILTKLGDNQWHMHKSNTSRNDTLKGIQQFEGELMGNFIGIWKFNQQLLSTS
jgi:hypothetical protein